MIANETVEARGEYWPEGAGPRPTTGILVVDTYPVKGTVYIDAEDCGKAPIEITLDKGDHQVAFGNVTGYEAPQAREVTIHAGGRKAISVEYKRIGLPGWAWAAIAIGGGVVVAAIATAVVRRR